MTEKDKKLEVIKRLMTVYYMTQEEAEEAYKGAIKPTQYIETNTIMSRNRKRNKYKNYKTNNKMRIIGSKVCPIKEGLKKFKVFVVGSPTVGTWTGMTSTTSIEEADVILFTGGEDVNPSLYGESVGTRTSFNDTRDAKEVEIFKQALDLNKKMIGICRGGQLGCVLSGGKLIQDVDGHSHTHSMILNYSGVPKEITISSSHHQMFYPYNLNPEEYRIIGYSKEKLSSKYLNGNDEQIEVPKYFRECEIVLFPETKFLAIQGHPEWMAESSESVKELQKMLLIFLQIKQFKKEAYEAYK
jgi:putative glutamine amidotransferase